MRFIADAAMMETILRVINRRIRIPGRIFSFQGVKAASGRFNFFVWQMAGLGICKPNKVTFSFKPLKNAFKTAPKKLYFCLKNWLQTCLKISSPRI